MEQPELQEAPHTEQLELREVPHTEQVDLQEAVMEAVQDFKDLQAVKVEAKVDINLTSVNMPKVETDNFEHFCY
jgi:hypothetical protein